jgi:hypothetical protein
MLNFLAGDMVWHRTERGLNSCNSSFPCFKCRVHKNDFYKKNYKLLNSASNNKLRSVEESALFCLNKHKEKEGYINKPIFDFIPFSKCHHDPLHETIRIPNYLLKLTHHLLIKLDNNNSKKIEKLPAQKLLFDWLKTTGIKVPIKLKEESTKASENNFILKTFTGSQWRKICMLITKEAIDRRIKDAENIVWLFNNFYRLNIGYTHNFYKDKISLFQKRVDEWKDKFNQVFEAKNNTCYIHYFTDHVASQIKEFGDIDLFNIEGLANIF